MALRGPQRPGFIHTYLFLVVYCVMQSYCGGVVDGSFLRQDFGLRGDAVMMALRGPQRPGFIYTY